MPQDTSDKHDTIADAKSTMKSFAEGALREGKEFLESNVDKIASAGKSMAASATEGVKDLAATTQVASELGVAAGEHREGSVTKAIEYHTSRIPSGTFLTAAAGALGISAYSYMRGRREDASFFGRLVSPILILGLYNKIVKLEGSEKSEG